MQGGTTWTALPTGYKVLLGGAAVLVLIYSNSGDTERPPTERSVEICAQSGQQRAYYTSHEMVRRKLKAPSTAKFPNWHAKDGSITVEYRGGCKFSVSAWVDSQNSFGAMIRTPYIVEVEYRPSSKDWYGTTLLIE